MDITRLHQIVPPLLSWFSENARTLPWRSDPTPYHVWVSEIMLQQTRVEAVKPFYARFLQALPDIAALASCPEDQLLKLWEGLGYYNRVRNMQKAAQVVMERFDGALPARYEELLTLPGIGHYSAGAIASIAYGQPVPAVDGNVLRVISRICENEEDIMKQSVRSRFEAEIGAVVPPDAPGAFNQSLMELGATVCVPNGAPLCAVCPVRDLCLAHEKGRETELPVKAAKKGRRIEQRTVLVIRDSARAAIRRRPKRGLLAGLYELPNYSGHLDQEEVLQLVKEHGLSPIRIRKLADARHIFSHVEWQMEGYLVLIEDQEKDHADDFLLIEPARTEQDYPVPAAFAAYMDSLSVKLGQNKFDVNISYGKD
jgi:A/G-specific adenine glycosylase